MKIKRYLPIIGVLIFVIILLKLDIREIIREIISAKLGFLFIALIFTLIFLITQTLKWWVIAITQKMNVPFIEALKINLISVFYGFITPSRIGVAIRAEYLRRFNNQKLGKGLSNYTIDKVLDLCSLVLIVIFAIIIGGSIERKYVYYFLAGFILMIFGLLIFLEEKRSKPILKFFYRKFIPKRFKEKAKNGFYSFYRDAPKKRYILPFLMLNIINWIVLETASFFIGLSLGINIPYLYYLAILPIATLASQIPITIGGLGTREAVLIGLFGKLGIEATKVVSLSIIGLILIGLIPSLIGAVLSLKEKQK